jgi:hypothetical protein
VMSSGIGSGGLAGGGSMHSVSRAGGHR